MTPEGLAKDFNPANSCEKSLDSSRRREISAANANTQPILWDMEMREGGS